jgi:hypothetical protein
LECEPSALKYFFPDADQQALFSPAERQLLSTQRTFTSDDPEYLAAFTELVGCGSHARMISENSAARVACYRGDERVASFTIHGSEAIEAEDGQRFRYSYGAEPATALALVSSSVRSFELRVRCAANLNHLWNRLRLVYDGAYRQSSDGDTVAYPATPQWCDTIALSPRDYERTRPRDTSVLEYLRIQWVKEMYVGDNASRNMAFACPGVGEGRCHYAMNPDCKVDSPGDTVLLFETKAGWNQHGGPELFTFDNHDPKGGCVLLNDGTVKFIRTEEELRQLRWRP